MLSGKVSTIAELAILAKQLKIEYPSHRLVFRGQRHDYSPTPSAERKKGDLTQAIMLSAWNHLSSYVLQERYPSATPLNAS